MNPFKELDVKNGLGVALDENANTFWSLNYIGQAAAAKKPTVFISSRFASATYRICCSKMMIRWDPALVKFIELQELVGDSMSLDWTTATKIIKETVETTGASQIIIDDCSVFERLGVPSADVAYSLLELYGSLPNDGTLLAQFSVDTQAYKMLENKADFSLAYETIGLGLGKDVTGKIIIAIKRSTFLSDKKELLYHTGDRGVKYFYPGNVPLQI